MDTFVQLIVLWPHEPMRFGSDGEAVRTGEKDWRPRRIRVEVTRKVAGDIYQGRTRLGTPVLFRWRDVVS